MHGLIRLLPADKVDALREVCPFIGVQRLEDGEERCVVLSGGVQPAHRARHVLLVVRRETRPALHEGHGRWLAQPAVVQRVGEEDQLPHSLAVVWLASGVSGGQRTVEREKHMRLRDDLVQVGGNALQAGDVLAFPPAVGDVEVEQAAQLSCQLLALAFALRRLLFLLAW